jgi:hypothetical protein
METSNHSPCAITISTTIPKQHIFRFENFWLQHRVFNIDQQSYERSTYHSDPAKIITTKFKRLRMALKT